MNTYRIKARKQNWIDGKPMPRHLDSIQMQRYTNRFDQRMAAKDLERDGWNVETWIEDENGNEIILP